MNNQEETEILNGLIKLEEEAIKTAEISADWNPDNWLGKAPEHCKWEITLIDTPRDFVGSTDQVSATALLVYLVTI